jgi:hypothetical protein
VNRARALPNDSLPADFADFIAILTKHRVDNVLVGGYALGIHGVVRATGDIDFLYRPTKLNVRRLCKALREFGAPGNVIDQAALLTPDTVTQFGQPPLRIDLLTSIDGVTFQEVLKGASIVMVGDSKMRVIGRAELLANKLATSRPRDLIDATTLMPKGRKLEKAKD